MKKYKRIFKAYFVTAPAVQGVTIWVPVEKSRTVAKTEFLDQHNMIARTPRVRYFDLRTKRSPAADKYLFNGEHKTAGEIEAIEKQATNA